MKRRRSTQGGGRQHGSSNTSNTNKKKQKNPPPKRPPVIGTVATRTRRQQKEITTKWKGPIPILINIMRYADPETIRMLCCVSKQLYSIIYNDPRMEHNRVSPLLFIRPSENTKEEGRLDRLFHQLQQHQTELQHIREIEIMNEHEFNCCDGNEIVRIREELRLHGVVSLDMSSQSKTVAAGNDWKPCLCNALGSILPNLCAINLSGTKYYCRHLEVLIMQCPHLEKITQNSIDQSLDISMDGFDMRCAQNLKEIYMDDSVFYCGLPRQLSDLDTDQYSNTFLFHRCSTKLERISIRNAMYSPGIGTTTVVPQNALIKFVRNAPSTLIWFRSSLTQTNIDMLRLERPQIEFLN